MLCASVVIEVKNGWRGGQKVIEFFFLAMCNGREPDPSPSTKKWSPSSKVEEIPVGPKRRRRKTQKEK